MINEFGVISNVFAVWNKCAFVLTLSDPDSEDTEEDEECCWGLGMDMGESALCGDTESLCCSSDPTLVPLLTTQGSCCDTSGFRGKTIKEMHVGIPAPFK